MDDNQDNIMDKKANIYNAKIKLRRAIINHVRTAKHEELAKMHILVEKQINERRKQG